MLGGWGGGMCAVVGFERWGLDGERLGGVWRVGLCCVWWLFDVVVGC